MTKEPLDTLFELCHSFVLRHLSFVIDPEAFLDCHRHGNA